MAARERRLREAGWLRSWRGGDTGKLLLCTRAGLRAFFRADLPVARFSPGTVQPTAITARVAASLELGRRQVLSEREIFGRERDEEGGCLGRDHRAAIPSTGSDLSW